MIKHTGAAHHIVAYSSNTNQMSLLSRRNCYIGILVPTQQTMLHAVQAHGELPITLVLGMATSAGALQQMLPVAAASMLEPHHFQLMRSMDR